ncbi:MAG: hypothetical protein ISS49_00510 [Anaerolineae bacterium]|nr:hypothetical protein [Anaerolineae bacterium]
MDHIKILKRAWETTWRYRALWVFGIILALTAGGVRGSGPQATFGGGNGNGDGNFPPPGDFYVPEISAQIVGVLIALGVALACVAVFLIIAATIARYVAETALIRLVDDHEETGEQRSVREGFRMGWSRTAFRLFLIKLLTGLPVALAFIPLFLLALAPLLLWMTESRVAGAVGTVATIGLFFLFVFLAIIVGMVLSLLMHFFRRACALEEVGVIEAIRQGYGIVRRHQKDLVVMWLIMVGLGLGWIIVMIPVTILLVLVGAVLGGFPALLIGGLASLVFEGAAPWILAGVVGFPIFILVVAASALFLGGLMEVFKSSVWTLTYRELRVLEDVWPEGT